MYLLDTERESLECRPTGLSIPRPHGSFVAEIEHLSGESDEPDPSAHRKDFRDGGPARSDDRDAAASPVIFKVGGTSSPSSIQTTVSNFQAALGGINNGNNPGPLPTGQRQINWDGGGGVNANTVSPTPFNGFENIRGALFTTPGTGFIQAPPSGGPQNGLAGQFNNATTAPFSAFSVRYAISPDRQHCHQHDVFYSGNDGRHPRRGRRLWRGVQQRRTSQQR